MSVNVYKSVYYFVRFLLHVPFLFLSPLMRCRMYCKEEPSVSKCLWRRVLYHSLINLNLAEGKNKCITCFTFVNKKKLFKHTELCSLRLLLTKDSLLNCN